MKIYEWARETQDSPFVQDGDDAFLLQLTTGIAVRAWLWFDSNIKSNFIFKLLGVTGKIEKIFTEIFGPRPSY